jgi:hypothetical protein
MLQYKRYGQLKNSLTQPDPFFIKQMACNELWHFMYKNVQLSQICCSSPEKPYITVEELEYIFRGYFKFSDMARRVNNRVKMFFYQLETFSLFSWVTESFELHCIFSPFVTKKTAWMTAENMLKILVRLHLQECANSHKACANSYKDTQAHFLDVRTLKE